MSVDCGISLEVIWFDQDVVEVFFTCSNEHFGGGAEIYLSHDDLPNLVKAMRGFPSNGSDTRVFELGTVSPAHANGPVRMNFYCRDSAAHAIVEVKLRGDGCKALGEVESVALRIAIEPAGIDAFLAELATMPIAYGARASLPMAK